MSDLFDTIRKIVHNELAQVRHAEVAVVQEQHPHASEDDTDNYACTVVLRNSGLVLPQVPVATSVIGMASIPNINDLVLVQFIGGDIQAPVITGRLYNDEDRPPVNANNQSIMNFPLGAGESDAVHIQLVSGDERSLLFQLGSGLKVECKDDDPVVVVEVDGGKATIQIDRDGAVTLESNGTLSIKSQEIKLEGTSINIEASGELVLKGATVNIN